MNNKIENLKNKLKKEVADFVPGRNNLEKILIATGYGVGVTTAMAALWYGVSRASFIDPSTTTIPECGGITSGTIIDLPNEGNFILEGHKITRKDTMFANQHDFISTDDGYYSNYYEATTNDIISKWYSLTPEDEKDHEWFIGKCSEKDKFLVVTKDEWRRLDPTPTPFPTKTPVAIIP